MQCYTRKWKIRGINDLLNDWFAEDVLEREKIEDVGLKALRFVDLHYWNAMDSVGAE
jgi:hypothetical protein